jgi:hypothetical protein
VEKALEVLLDARVLTVSALAQRAGLRVGAAAGFAVVLRQLLNFDGIQVLEPLPDGRTLRLHTGLLREQFALGRRCATSRRRGMSCARARHPTTSVSQGSIAAAA